MSKLTERDLVAIIKAHRTDSLGAEDGDLSSQRAKAMDHYHGRPYGNEVAGRSSVVSRDLAEAVDWALPAIIRAFVQSGSLGEFDPVGPDDEQGAQQESDYVNQVMMKDNPGFMVLHDAIKDTLLLKNGYTKHLWEVSEKVRDESYEGLTTEQLIMLLEQLESDGSKVEVLGQDVKQAMVAGQPVDLYDIKLKIVKKCGKCLWTAVPAEEVRVSKKCRGSLQDSPFTEHVTKKTRSALIEMGMPRGFVDSLPAFNEDDNDSEKYARDSVTDESDSSLGQALIDRSMDEIEFCEAYIRVDWDGDGVAELRKVVTVADRIPPGEEWNEPIPAVPMTGFVMKRVPHRHVGESLDDELADLQEIKTVLNRQLLDNIYLTNNQRTFINERVNPRDLMTSTPGGVIRIKGDGPVGDSAMPFVTAPILDKILPVIDYWDRTKESRTGITKASTGMDPDILKESTKGAFLENLNRASQKIEMITRMLAESGVKESFLQVHGILMRHQDVPRMVQLRGKWVNVNPQEWKERTDMTVRVGLGTGNEEEKRQKLLLLANLQTQILQAATMAPPPVYEKMHALFEEVAKTMGFDVPEKFALAPNSPEYQQLIANKPQVPPDPAIVVEQMRQQGDQQKFMAQAQLDEKLEMIRNEFSANQKRLELELQAANDQRDADREALRAQYERDLKMAEMERDERIKAAELEVKKYEIDRNNEVKLMVQQMSTGSEVPVPPDVSGGPHPTVMALKDTAGAVAGAMQMMGEQQNQALSGITQTLAQVAQTVAGAAQQITQAAQVIAKPKQIVRGPDGKVIGVQ